MTRYWASAMSRDAGQRVPPPGLLGAADPLRVQHEHPPDLGAQPDGEGVDVDLVRGGHHRPDRGQHRGHHQGGGLVRPRPGDLQDARLPRLAYTSWRPSRPSRIPMSRGSSRGRRPAPRPGHAAGRLQRGPQLQRAALRARARPCRARRGGGPATAPRCRTGRGRRTTRSPRRRRRAPGRSAPRRRSRTAPREPWAPISGSRLASRVASASAATVAPPQSGTVRAADSDAATPGRHPGHRHHDRAAAQDAEQDQRGGDLGQAQRRPARPGHRAPAGAVVPGLACRRPVVGECQAWSVS